MKKLIAEIFWEEDSGETIIKFQSRTLENLKCQPICFLDLRSDLTSKWFDEELTKAFREAMETKLKKVQEK